MNKILVVARGKNIDQYKIINSLQKMILDPKNERISCFYANEVQYDYTLFFEKMHEEENVFMAQIVDKNDKSYPLDFSLKNEEKSNNRHLVISGYFDEEQVKESGMIEKVFEDEDIREKVYNNLSNLPKYLCNELKEPKSLEYFFRGIDSMISVIRLDYPFFSLHSGGKTIVFEAYNNDTSYYSNSREVIEDLGLKWYPEKRFYTITGYSTGWTTPQKEEVDSVVFPNRLNILKDNFINIVSSINDKNLQKKILKEYESLFNYYKKMKQPKIKVYTNKNSSENN